MGVTRSSQQTNPWSVPANAITVSANGGAMFATVTEAIAAMGVGQMTVLVFGGTYAENPGAVPDGGVIHGIGNPVIGTGAGPVFTVASPGTGEIARLTGCMTVSATACLTATAGAIFEVDPDVTLSGTTAGPWRIGRTIYLASGDAIATYAPADGSLCAVAEGDELWYGTENVTVHMETVGGTDYWVGQDLNIGTSGPFDAPFNIDGTALTQLNIALPDGSAGFIARTFKATTYAWGTNNGTDYWTISLKFHDTVYATISTGTVPDATGKYIYHDVAVDTYIVAYADLADTPHASMAYAQSLKFASSGHFSAFGVGGVYAPVYE